MLEAERYPPKGNAGSISILQTNQHPTAIFGLPSRKFMGALDPETLDHQIQAQHRYDLTGSQEQF